MTMRFKPEDLPNQVSVQPRIIIDITDLLKEYPESEIVIKQRRKGYAGAPDCIRTICTKSLTDLAQEIGGIS